MSSYRVALFLFLFLVPYLVLGERNILLYDNNKNDNDLFYPIEYYFNSAFDTWQNPDLFNQEHYFKKQKIVWERVKDPKRGIDEGGGFKKLIADEFFGKRVAPNIALHFIGSGYDHRRLTEWFYLHNYPLPVVWATIMAYAGHFGNEALEVSDTKNITAHDHIADMLFFDLFGKIAFSYDSVASFFHKDLGMRAWHMLPVINPDGWLVSNAGLSYIFRPSLFSDTVRPFLYLGMQNMAGVSLTHSKGITWTPAAGVAWSDPLARKGRLVYSLFADRDGVLLGSLMFNGGEHLRVRLNVYPALFADMKTRLGIFAAYRRDDDIGLGINWQMPVGLGGFF